ncbi:MAG: hypothetical protein M3O46_18340, partial [Myxococcota bacterium]|nr:hypothetical protein [Myxococcota bacterium]
MVGFGATGTNGRGLTGAGEAAGAGADGTVVATKLADATPPGEDGAGEDGAVLAAVGTGASGCSEASGARQEGPFIEVSSTRAFDAAGWRAKTIAATMAAANNKVAAPRIRAADRDDR